MLNGMHALKYFHKLATNLPQNQHWSREKKYTVVEVFNLTLKLYFIIVYFIFSSPLYIVHYMRVTYKA